MWLVYAFFSSYVVLSSALLENKEPFDILWSHRSLIF